MNGISRRQNGLSLVELMIALAISSFLILGITQFYIDNKSNYLFQQGQSSNLNKGRFAVLMLEQVLARAGYRAEPWNSLAVAFPAISAGNGCPAFSAGETVKANSAGNGLCIRYQAAEDAGDYDLDCLGEDVEADASVLLNLAYDSAEGTLSCRVSGASAVLIDNVAGFVVGDLPDSDATNQSIRFAVLLGSGSSLRGGVESDVITRWNSLSGETLSSDSKRIYQIAQGSVALRNLMP
ncbi:hypothetical protein BZL41_17315 [Pseudomonas sp. PIC25]|uniref:PilW family protein n=1 Tax=Pseudomonas sp. PIC25 TaxID=1958773 RepID=UPI000BABD0F6|nr:prepilin-type N-terminal cleavage/methylation domain-containing protein [Pseudomonas sp. PIC25]PAU58980.1 hypothetical protein BZL41_17315 [Pseudomonas sp. PIC25]